MSLYDDVGGFDAILDICRRWHELCLADPVASHPFSRGGHPQHVERLAAYLAETWGGPRVYSAGYGDESYVQRLHAGNQMQGGFADLLSGLFERAVADAGTPEPAAGRAISAWRSATRAMRPYDLDKGLVPDDLPMPVLD